MVFPVSVDASEAGAGNLEVAVRAVKTGARIPHFLEADDRSTGLFQIRFTPPPDCFRYEIDVSFNDLSVSGVSCSLVLKRLLHFLALAVARLQSLVSCNIPRFTTTDTSTHTSSLIIHDSDIYSLHLF